MRRPRHREKSSLLWKALGIAAVINLVLWPALVHEGVFAGVRQEVLIPVRLVSLPPSHKPPDALQKVTRTQTLIPAAASSASSTSLRRRTSPKPSVRHIAAVPKAAAPHPPPAVIPIAAKKPAKASPPVHAKLVAQKPVPNAPSHIAKQTPAAQHYAEPHPAHMAQAKSVPLDTPPRHDVHRKPTGNTAQGEQPTLQSRVARAKQLEAQGHQVAEQIARERAARVASLPPPAKAVSPVAAESPSTLPNTGDAAPQDKIAAITPAQEAPTSSPPVTAVFVPAVAVSKSHPTVPDWMMRSAWHATFRGRFTVHTDGTAEVRMVSSTGFPILDRRAIKAARLWKFRPARLNGTAITSSQTFAFEYDVHPVP